MACVRVEVAWQSQVTHPSWELVTLPPAWRLACEAGSVEISSRPLTCFEFEAVARQFQGSRRHPCSRLNGSLQSWASGRGRHVVSLHGEQGGRVLDHRQHKPRANMLSLESGQWHVSFRRHMHFNVFVVLCCRNVFCPDAIAAH